MHPTSSLKTIVIFFGAWMLALNPAAADMLVSPTRAVLDQDNRSAEFTLRNTGDGPRTYRLEWVEQRMDASGGFVPIAEGEEWSSAAAMLRYSPRQITVGPGENQLVRVKYRPPADVTAGEYRSYLRLQVLADVSEPAMVLEQGQTDGNGLGFRINMQMSFNIPVVVRHNAEPAKVRLKEVDVLQPDEEGQSLRLGVTLARRGQASSFGTVLVEMQRDRNSPLETIGRRNGIAVFHEMSERRVIIPLRDEAIPAGAWVRVAYEGRQEHQGQVWDEQVFKVD